MKDLRFEIHEVDHNYHRSHKKPCYRNWVKRNIKEVVLVFLIIFSLYFNYNLINNSVFPPNQNRTPAFNGFCNNLLTNTTTQNYSKIETSQEDDEISSDTSINSINSPTLKPMTQNINLINNSIKHIAKQNYWIEENLSSSIINDSLNLVNDSLIGMHPNLKYQWKSSLQSIFYYTEIRSMFGRLIGFNSTLLMKTIMSYYNSEFGYFSDDLTKIYNNSFENRRIGYSEIEATAYAILAMNNLQMLGSLSSSERLQLVETFLSSVDNSGGFYPRNVYINSSEPANSSTFLLHSASLKLSYLCYKALKALGYYFDQEFIDNLAGFIANRQCTSGMPFDIGGFYDNELYSSPNLEYSFYAIYLLEQIGKTAVINKGALRNFVESTVNSDHIGTFLNIESYFNAIPYPEFFSSIFGVYLEQKLQLGTTLNIQGTIDFIISNFDNTIGTWRLYKDSGMYSLHYSYLLLLGIKEASVGLSNNIIDTIIYYLRDYEYINSTNNLVYNVGSMSNRIVPLEQILNYISYLINVNKISLLTETNISELINYCMKYAMSNYPGEITSFSTIPHLKMEEWQTYINWPYEMDDSPNRYIFGGAQVNYALKIFDLLGKLEYIHQTYNLTYITQELKDSQIEEDYYKNDSVNMIGGFETIGALSHDYMSTLVYPDNYHSLHLSVQAIQSLIILSQLNDENVNTIINSVNYSAAENYFKQFYNEDLRLYDDISRGAKSAIENTNEIIGIDGELNLNILSENRSQVEDLLNNRIISMEWYDSMNFTQNILIIESMLELNGTINLDYSQNLIYYYNISDINSGQTYYSQIPWRIINKLYKIAIIEPYFMENYSLKYPDNYIMPVLPIKIGLLRFSNNNESNTLNIQIKDNFEWKYLNSDGIWMKPYNIPGKSPKDYYELRTDPELSNRINLTLLCESLAHDELDFYVYLDLHNITQNEIFKMEGMLNISLLVANNSPEVIRAYNFTAFPRLDLKLEMIYSLLPSSNEIRLNLRFFLGDNSNNRYTISDLQFNTQIYSISYNSSDDTYVNSSSYYYSEDLNIKYTKNNSLDTTLNISYSNSSMTLSESYSFNSTLILISGVNFSSALCVNLQIFPMWLTSHISLSSDEIILDDLSNSLNNSVNINPTINNSSINNSTINNSTINNSTISNSIENAAFIHELDLLVINQTSTDDLNENLNSPFIDDGDYTTDNNTSSDNSDQYNSTDPSSDSNLDTSNSTGQYDPSSDSNNNDNYDNNDNNNYNNTGFGNDDGNTNEQENAENNNQGINAMLQFLKQSESYIYITCGFFIGYQIITIAKKKRETIKVEN